MSDPSTRPPKRGNLGSAIAGGLIGSAVTAALLVFAAPDYLSSRIVRQGLLSDPRILSDTVDALRDAQYAPVLATNRAAIETPFGSSWKGAAQPQVTLVEFYDYACPYCKASNPHLDRLLSEDKGLRIVYRELPILGPDSLTAARVSLAASKAGHFAQFHDALWAAGRPAADTIAAAAQSAGVAPTPPSDPLIEAELKRNFTLAGQLGATGTPLFVVGDRVLNGAVGYEALKQAIAEARAKGT
ncbi:MAG TPA: DsbA family protein [Sphingomicrobium sp.]|nr:DsbA family protein [Sphingomicrobium sp.]